jgi:hypothetical protein
MVYVPEGEFLSRIGPTEFYKVGFDHYHVKIAVPFQVSHVSCFFMSCIFDLFRACYECNLFKICTLLIQCKNRREVGEYKLCETTNPSRNKWNLTSLSGIFNQLRMIAAEIWLQFWCVWHCIRSGWHGYWLNLRGTLILCIWLTELNNRHSFLYVALRLQWLHIDGHCFWHGIKINE